MRSSRVLPATGRGPRPRGKHAAGQIHQGITQRRGEDLLTRPSLRVAQNVRQVQIELTRSRCGAMTPEGPARAFATPPSLPRPRAAKARTAIGPICPSSILHIEIPFSARVDSRDGSLQEYDGSRERNKPPKMIRKSCECFFWLRWQSKADVWPGPAGAGAERITVFRNGALRRTTRGRCPAGGVFETVRSAISNGRRVRRSRARNVAKALSTAQTGDPRG
jgi:hypothetical protein